jgi:hypothetical protein
MLGDALKQIRAFEYALLHLGEHDTGGTFQDKQAKYPIVIRHNGKTSKIYLKVDKVKQAASVQIQEEESNNGSGRIGHDTEIEVTLPVIDQVKHTLNRAYIEDFCRKYPLFTTDITFRFHVTDNSDYTVGDTTTTANDDGSGSTATTASNSKERLMIEALKAKSPKATEHIEYKALHPISKESCSERNSVHSYTREEFKRRLVNIDQKQAESLTVYDVLKRTYREATNLGRTDKNTVTIADLLSLPDKERNKKIEGFYKDLCEALPAPPKLVLPYTSDKHQRKEALASRLLTFNQNTKQGVEEELDNDINKAAYKSLHGFHEDRRRGISYPYFFEILAIPFANPLQTSTHLAFVGAINYSISPKPHGSVFESDKYYESFYRTDEKTGEGMHENVKDIFGVLEFHGFYTYQTDRARLPCFIIANLATPRRDPHGQDKSRIDTTAFASTISYAVTRLTTEIKTYRGAGYTYSRPSERRTAEYHSSGKRTLKTILAEYLVNEHGLSASDAAKLGYYGD